MTKYYWDDDNKVILDSTGKVYQMMYDGSVDITDQSPLILYGHEIKMSKKKCIDKLCEQLELSFDEEISYHQQKALEIENNKMYLLMKIRRELKL